MAIGTPYTIVSGISAAGSATYQLTVTASTTAGDAIVVSTGWNVNSTLPTCTDSQSNTYVLQVSDVTQTSKSAIFTAVKGPGGTGPTVALANGTDWIKVTYTGTSAVHAVIARGCSGISAADVTASADSAGSASPSAGPTPALSQSSEWATGLIVNSSGGGPPASFTGGFAQTVQAHSSGNIYATTAEQVVSSTAALTLGATITSTVWSALIVTLEAATTPGTATIAGAGSMTSLVTTEAAAAITGAGTVTARVTEQAPTAMSGAGSMSSAATTGASASMAGAGSVTASGTVEIEGTATLAGAGTMVAVSNSQASAVMAGAGSMTFTTPTVFGFSSIPGAAIPGLSTPGYPVLASVTPPVPGVVQQIKGSSYSEYGLHAVEITTQPGHGVIVYAGWDRSYLPSPAPVPACYVSDSAGNKWYHLGTSDAGNSGARCAIWASYCVRGVGQDEPGWVSVSLTGFASSLAYLVVEVDNLPALIVPDVSVTSSDPAVTSTAITAAGTASFTGLGFGMAVAGDAGVTLTVPPGGWDALEPVSAGGSEQGSVQIFPYLRTVTAGNLEAAFTVSPGAPLAAALATVQGSPLAPVQPNPNFPLVKVEMGFGALPGDVSDAPPPRTDITGRAIGKLGDPWIQGSYGRQYELASPEAGTLTVGLRNSDGAFTPGNVNSPYWTNALSANPGFQQASIGSDGLAVLTGTTAGWKPLNNAMLGVQNQYVYEVDGTGQGFAAVLTPDGMTANPGLAVAMVPVGSKDYGASALCYFPAAWSGGVQALIGWYDTATSELLGTTTGAVTAVTAGAWTQLSVRASAWQGSFVAAVAYFQLGGTPPAGMLSYWYSAGLCNGGQLVQAGCVRDLVPVWTSLYWAGYWYDLGSGYVQAWPQEWPDLKQYGLSKMKAADSLAVMASCTMPSAVQGQVLIDSPFVYLPCGEQYLTATTGLTASTSTLNSYEFAEAQGLQCVNASLTNQRYGIYVDGGGEQVQTGLALNLLGDQGTGMGTSSYSGTQGAGAGPGVVYADPGLPSPAVAAGAGGVSAECWFVQTDTNSPSLMIAYANSSPYSPAPFPELLGAAFLLTADGGDEQLVAYLPGTVLAIPYASSANAQHVALVFTPPVSGTTWTVQAWLNGQLGGSTTVAASDLLAWNAVTLGAARYSFGAPPFKGNFTLGHAAITAGALSPARIQARYWTGIYGTVSGPGGDTPQQRTAAILCWGQLGIPRGGPLTLSGATEPLFLGPAYDVGTATATDALNIVTTSEGGLATVMPGGALTYLPRWWLYNLAPTVTFGDANNPADGEVPFLPGQGWDFDTTYLQNQAAITRVDGPTTSITASWRDLASGKQNFTRSALSQQIETTSDDDAYDASTWLVSQYAQSVLRVKSMVIDAASNPAAAFPVVLTTRVGTVATANRRPIGGAPISTQVQVQKIGFQIGANLAKWTYQMSPYNLPGSVLQADADGFNTLGSVLALPR